MTQQTCLLLRPQPSTAKGQIAQQDDMRDIVEEAIKRAGLDLISPSLGLEINNDMPEDIINRVYDADIVVIDVNCYELKNNLKYSPFLYYLIGMRHTLGNQTILVSADMARPHLPASLQMRHTLFYGKSVANARDFARRFKTLIEQFVDEGDSGDPGNPVQDHRIRLEQKALEEEQEKGRAEKKALEEELEKGRVEKKDLEEKMERMRIEIAAAKRSQPIKFRPLNKKKE